MNNRNYNFKIRLNANQRVSLISLAQANGFNNVSQFIRQMVLNKKETSNNYQRLLINNGENLDYDTILSLCEKVKYSQTTDQYLNCSQYDFLYVIQNEEKLQYYKKLFKIYDKNNMSVITLKDYLDTSNEIIKNRLVIFQNSILVAINNFGLKYYNENLCLSKTIHQLSKIELNNKNKEKEFSIQDSEAIYLSVLYMDFKHVEFDLSSPFGQRQDKHKVFKISWLKDYIQFSIKNKKLTYKYRLIDTQKIISNVFNENFICFQQLKQVLEKYINVSDKQLQYSFEILRQVILILQQMLRMESIDEDDKLCISKMLKINHNKDDIYSAPSTKNIDDIPYYFYILSNLINGFYQKKQPIYSMITNKLYYDQKIKSLQQKKLYSAKKNLQIAYIICNKGSIVNWNLDQNILKDVLKKEIKKDNEQQSLFGDQNYDYTNSIVQNYVQNFNKTYKNGDGKCKILATY